MKKLLLAAVSAVALSVGCAHATITQATVQVVDAGNGSTTVFNYGFLVPFQPDGATSAVTVQVEDASGNLTTLAPTAYTINGVGNPNGGTVVYPLAGSALPLGAKLIITRNQNYIQPTVVKNTSFYPHTVEQVADWDVGQIQQLRQGLSQTVQFPNGDVTNYTLPTAQNRANTVFGFDSNGLPTLASGAGTLPIPVPISDGGTGATNAAQAFANLSSGGTTLGIPNAKHDGVIFADGAISATTQSFSSPSAAFKNADVGKGIVVVGAGPATHATGFLDLIQNANATDTFTVNGSTVTVVASGATGAQINKGASAAITAANLVTYLTANVSGVTAAITGAAGSAHITITATATGTGGNAIGLSASCGYNINDSCGAERVAVSNSTLLGGASSSSAFGTITGINSTTSVNVSFTAANTVSGANGYYASDDSGAINAALASGAGNLYLLGPYNYGISSTITPPMGVSWWGQGQNAKVLALGPITMFNDNQVSGLGVDFTHTQQLYFEGGGVATTCFYTGPYVVKDFFVSNFASDCATGFEIDGTQNSTFLNDETSNQLVGSTGSGAGSPVQYSYRVLNGASGNNFINDEAAGAGVRSWQFAPDSGEPGFNTFPGGTNQGPLSNYLSGGIEENGCAPIGVDFVNAGFTTWQNPVFATGGCTNPAGPNVSIGASSFFIAINDASINAGGSNRSSTPAIVNNGFQDSIGMMSFSGAYGAGACLLVANGAFLNLPYGTTGLGSAGYLNCNNNSSGINLALTVKHIDGEPNVTTNQLNVGGIYQTNFGRVFVVTPTFGLYARPIHFEDAFVQIAYTSTETPNIALGSNFFTILTGNVTIANPTNVQNGMEWSMEINQDGTGSRTVAWGNKYIFPGGPSTCTASTGANNIDYFTFKYDGALIQTRCSLNMHG